MSENPYQAPRDAETSQLRPYRSRGQAAANGALHGLCFTAKWTTVIAGPLLALATLAISGLALSRWWSGGADADGLMLVALNLMILAATGILQLFSWIVMFSLFGAAIQAIRETIRFKPGHGASAHAEPG